jgi:hypothetical protein
VAQGKILHLRRRAASEEGKRSRKQDERPRPLNFDDFNGLAAIGKGASFDSGRSWRIPTRRVRNASIPETPAFDAIKEWHPIGDICGAEGTGSGEPDAAANRAKNNFCASGPTESIGRGTFARLRQVAVEG